MWTAPRRVSRGADWPSGVAAYARCAPGCPSCTTNDATVLIGEVGVCVVSMPRKSARSCDWDTEQRT
jgi:hypothetical protein